MHPKRNLPSPRRLDRLPLLLLGAAGLLGAWGPGLCAQVTQVPVPAGKPSRNASAAPQSPPAARRPPLEVDTDPVRSPDPEPPPAPPAGASVPTPGAPGQPSDIEKQENGMYVLRTHVDEVLINCAVVDARGNLVTDLERRNFHVQEDGVPQAINSVQHLDLPVSMGILIDDSGSMRDKRSVVNKAANLLLEDSNPGDEAFVVNFADRPYLDQHLTTDRVALRRGITRSDPAGTTALYDAVAASADELAKHGKNQKQVLLIITDGADNASRLSLEEAIRRVAGLGGPVVYAIGLLFDAGRSESAQSRDALAELTEQTGGLAYFPRSLEELDSIASSVAGDIRHQYLIDYHSSKSLALGGYRTVRVEVSDPHRGNLVVRAKRGFYAKSEQQRQAAQQAGQTPVPPSVPSTVPH